MFSECGTVISVTIPFDFVNQRGRGLHLSAIQLKKQTKQLRC